MSLRSGDRVGAYEVLSLIGVGGMGHVYRARDTRLGRDVALKLLPDAFALDGDRVARFEREAQLLASLNHQNIATVEGPTLADRIAQGPIPYDEALPIARQIVAALEVAHAHGVYDAASDGRFLMVAAPSLRDASVTVVQNWVEEAKRLAPPR